MAKTIYTNEFPSTTQALGETLTAALDSLVDHDWCSKDNSFSIRLCLEEALVNAVVHGNKNQPDRMVRIEISEVNGRCRICVEDQGKGFDPDGMAMPDCRELGGRGVCLIKHYMDDVRFDQENNCLRMEFDRETFKVKV